jgi:alpha-ketoglutarate-dependent taurine dioxygenase
MKKVRTHNKKQEDDWMNAIGTTELPILSLLPEPAETPSGLKNVYMVDLETLTKKQHEKLVKHLAERYHLTEEEVRSDINTIGVPIIADDCQIITNEIGRYL